jgi:hypothetical protein
MYKDYDKLIKVGDLVSVRRSLVGDLDRGIVLDIYLDTTYDNIKRYHVKYFSLISGKEQVQWANHVEVISKAHEEK